MLNERYAAGASTALLRHSGILGTQKLHNGSGVKGGCGTEYLPYPLRTVSGALKTVVRTAGGEDGATKRKSAVPSRPASLHLSAKEDERFEEIGRAHV